MQYEHKKKLFCNSVHNAWSQVQVAKLHNLGGQVNLEGVTPIHLDWTIQYGRWQKKNLLYFYPDKPLQRLIAVWHRPGSHNWIFPPKRQKFLSADLKLRNL